MSRVLVGLVVCGVLWGSGCSGEEPGILKLRPGGSVDDAPECSPGELACPAGTSCMTFTLEGVHYLRCFDGSICTERVRCTGGTECTLLETHPTQVTCSGSP